MCFTTHRLVKDLWAKGGRRLEDGGTGLGGLEREGERSGSVRRDLVEGKPELVVQLTVEGD